MNAEALISLEWNSMFKSNEKLPKDLLSALTGSRERKIDRVLPGGVGPVPSWHGKEPATSLSTSSIFRDSLVPDPCGGLRPGLGEQGALALSGEFGSGRCNPGIYAQSDRKGTPSVFYLPSLGHVALEVAWWCQGLVGRTEHSSLGLWKQRREL